MAARPALLRALLLPQQDTDYVHRVLRMLSPERTPSGQRRHTEDTVDVVRLFQHARLTAPR
ncbi:hypothetical protein ACIRQP_30640 [Streptomyces sp. NPDC102274]|uniref:hypothetical protein n=1 Tax=Streptomyces sp. NPDC102274 TaxID=3366151 RepID=UPI00380101AD